MPELDGKPGVGVLGLGIMGTALARNLDEEGLLSAAWNRSPKPGFPKFRTSVQEAVCDSEIILILVTDNQAVSDVLGKIEPGLDKQHLIVQCSTVKPASNIEFQQRVEKRGARFIEALIGGSKSAAINRQIIFYTGGKETDVQRAEPVLTKLSAKCIHVGEVGKASAAKLAMNLNIAMQVEALCESFAYAERAGIDPDTFFTVLNNNTAWNRLAEYKEPALRNKDFLPQFSVKNMLKDVRLALETDRTDYGLTLLAAVEKIYANAEKAGLGEDDMSALYKLLNNQ
jgi:3-hydroxyisobutyrate dehydrogenase-like beta-hydroxyacid dehydrogenase